MTRPIVVEVDIILPPSPTYW